MKKVLFVCSMNTVRSAMAEIITNELYGMDYTADSAGMNADNGGNMDYDARCALLRAGYSPEKINSFHSKRVNNSLVMKADRIVAVSVPIEAALKLQYPDYRDKITSFTQSIGVPMEGDVRGFDDCFVSLNCEIEKVLYPNGYERWKPKSEK